ncbi:serine protease [Micromonospora sp. CPCC 205539]|uniref:serine protease n=1 Tax=Micromonospora sp. CPCC 205539 TaxID=3122408 RepID=UPI002FF3C32B
MVNHGDEPWRVRLRGHHGEVLGAGMAVDNRHVLTCAHVVGAASETDLSQTEPAWSVDVDLIGQPGGPTVSARVVPGCWAPPTDEVAGDVALLELAAPLAHGPFAPLRRQRTWGRHVVAYGFPETLEQGVYVRAQLAGPSGAGRERVQMDSATTGPQISPGFSGAAVVDAATKAVVGMVVSTYRASDHNRDVAAGTDPASGLSWMIPVETILRYLPQLGDRVPGEPSVDDSFRSLTDTPVDGAMATRIAEFFSRKAHGNVLIIVTVDQGSGSAAAVRQAAVLSSRELRPQAGPVGFAVPPMGSIDLAVDAAGKSTGAVSQRIADWAGGADGATSAPGNGGGAETTPRSLILSNIDEAADSETLLSEVVLPLVAQAPARDLRMLLTFRGESVPLRLALLASRIATLQSTEEAARRAHRRAAALAATVPPVRPLATELRIQLTKLRAAAASTDRDALAALLAATERVTDRALRKAEAVRQEVVAREDLWAELRGRLDAYLAMAVRHGSSEDPALGTLHRRAHDLLMAAPCDLAAAGEAVRVYAEAVPQQVDDQHEGSGR